MVMDLSITCTSPARSLKFCWMLRSSQLLSKFVSLYNLYTISPCLYFISFSGEALLLILCSSMVDIPSITEFSHTFNVLAEANSKCSSTNKQLSGMQVPKTDHNTQHKWHLNTSPIKVCYSKNSSILVLSIRILSVFALNCKKNSLTM